jgi:hypothetical protein
VLIFCFKYRYGYYQDFPHGGGIALVDNWILTFRVTWARGSRRLDQNQYPII